MWAFCWICFCCPGFQYSGLLVSSTVLGFLHVRLSLQEPLPSWASVVSGSHLSGLSRGCFSQVKSEKRQHICQGSLSFPRFCLTTAKNLKWWMDQCWLVLQLSFIWQAKENTSSRCGGVQTQRNKEKRGTWLNFGSSFYMFFLLPLSLPCVNWDSQEGCLFYLRFSLLTLYLPLFYFWCVFSFLCFLATAIMDSLFLFQLPIIVIPDKITVQKCKKQMSF